MRTHPAMLALVAFAATTIHGGSATATTLTFDNDRPAFLSATSSSTLGALPPSGGTGTVVGIATFSDGPSASIEFSGFSEEIAGPALGASGKENFDILLSSPVYAFGFSVHEPSYLGGSAPLGCNATCADTTFQIEILDGAISLGTFTFNAPDDPDPSAGGPLGFWGISSSTPFTTLRVRDLTDTIDNEYFGDFAYSSVASIPEPSSLAQMLAGALLVVAIGAGKVARRPQV